MLVPAPASALLYVREWPITAILVLGYGVVWLAGALLVAGLRPFMSTRAAFVLGGVLALFGIPFVMALGPLPFLGALVLWASALLWPPTAPSSRSFKWAAVAVPVLLVFGPAALIMMLLVEGDGPPLLYAVAVGSLLALAVIGVRVLRSRVSSREG